MGSARYDPNAAQAVGAGLTLIDPVTGLGRIQAPKTPATLVNGMNTFGDILNAGTGFGNQFEIGNTSGSSSLRLGQSGSRNMGFTWSFNATPANARAVLDVFGYSNPLDVDALLVTLQGLSGKSVVVGGAAIATTAVDGFLCISKCAGTPTGVPSNANGIAMVYDTTANKIWFYNGSWRGVLVA